MSDLLLVKAKDIRAGDRVRDPLDAAVKRVTATERVLSSPDRLPAVRLDFGDGSWCVVGATDGLYRARRR